MGADEGVADETVDKLEFAGVAEWELALENVGIDAAEAVVEAVETVGVEVVESVAVEAE